MESGTAEYHHNDRDNVDDDSALGLTWIKLVGIGHAGVGKTCLIRHFCERKFSSVYEPTVGVDYGFKIETIHHIDLRVHIWDLAGGSEYADVRSELYDGSHVVLLVYDVTSVDTFRALDTWLDELATCCKTAPLLAVVANKVDLKNSRKISLADGRKWANLHGVRHYETSCLTGESIQRVFVEILQGVVAKMKGRNELPTTR